MRRKFELYRKAGVRGYWELDPESKTLFTHCFKDGSVITRYCHSGETVPVGIFQDLAIRLEPVFAE
jgi:hypothetical protein